MKLNNVEFEQKDVDEIVHLAITHNMTQDQIHAGLIRASRK